MNCFEHFGSSEEGKKKSKEHRFERESKEFNSKDKKQTRKTDTQNKEHEITKIIRTKKKKPNEQLGLKTGCMDQVHRLGRRLLIF